MITLSIKIAVFIFLITFFYYYIKSCVFIHAGRIATLFRITRLYSFEVSKGVIELPTIVILHFLFCVLLLKLTQISFVDLRIFDLSNPLLLSEGCLLGIGVMGASSLLGRIYIEIMRYMFPKKYPSDIRNWLAMARGGWIRHHFHVLEVLPIPIALTITLGQVCAEEIVFRGVLMNYFHNNGDYIALVISTLLFMIMQIFHMSNRVSSVFPVIGALVLGVTGGLMYVHVHTLLPLIIAHITFFAVAVL